MQMLARAQSSNVKKGFIFEQKNLILSNILRQQSMYLYILHRIIVEKISSNASFRNKSLFIVYTLIKKLYTRYLYQK